MKKIRFNIDPDKIIIGYFLIGMLMSSLILSIGLFVSLPVSLPKIIFVLYHGVFWIFFGWYGSNYYKIH